MRAVTGIFTSLEAAKRAGADLRTIGIPQDRINFLTPGAPEKEVHSIPTEDAEQPGMGAAVGGVVGTAVGSSAGATLGLAAASAFVPGVGPAIAIGLTAAALLGIAGATGGAVAGAALEEAMSDGVPKDELFVYEDALRQGRTVLIVLTEGDERAASARKILSAAGAESIDAAREQWWVGLRDSEKEHYNRQNENFDRDENDYRRGFEAALHAETRGRTYEEAAGHLKIYYAAVYSKQSFRRGYERGRAYYKELQKNHARHNSV